MVAQVKTQDKKFHRISVQQLLSSGVTLGELEGRTSKCFIVEGKRYLINRVRIICSNWVSYTVWEAENNHSTITSTYIDDSLPFMERITSENIVRWGRLGSRRLPSDTNSLPVGAERFKAVDKFLQDQYQLAYQLIHEAYPEASLGTESMGEIELFFDS